MKNFADLADLAVLADKCPTMCICIALVEDDNVFRILH